MNLLWQNKNYKEFPKLEEDKECEILIVGGGLCGILIAHKLNNNNNVIVLEKNYIGSGITQNSTATISIIQDKLYKDKIKEIGFKKTKQYVLANKEALKEFKMLSKQYDFDYKEESVINYIYNDDKTFFEEFNALESLDLNPKLYELNNKNIKALEIENQATCNPLKLVNELAKNLTIFEHSKVIKLNTKYALLENGCKVFFKKVIIATHYPLFDKGCFFFLKMYQVRSAVLLIKHEELNNFYISMQKGDLYIRSYNNYLLIGGYDYRVGECKNALNSLKEKVIKHFNKDITYQFVNQDLITLDSMPYIGKTLFKNIYVATGFNEYGFTSSMIASIMFKDIFEKGYSSYQKLLAPNRFMYLKNLLKQIKYALKNLLSFKCPRCTHMKSKLNYNVFDNTYECELHGSRFNYNGEVKNEPAKKNIKHKKM